MQFEEEILNLLEVERAMLIEKKHKQADTLISLTKSKIRTKNNKRNQDITYAQESLSELQGRLEEVGWVITIMWRKIHERLDGDY